MLMISIFIIVFIIIFHILPQFPCDDILSSSTSASSSNFKSSHIGNISRILTEIHLPPVNGDHNDYSQPFLHHISHTTNQETIKQVFQTLKAIDPARFQSIDTNQTLLLEAVDMYLTLNQSYFHQVPSDIIHNLFLGKTSTTSSSESIFGKHHGHHSSNSGNSNSNFNSNNNNNNINNKRNTWLKSIEGRRIQDMFDVVLVIECNWNDSNHITSIVTFFNEWKSILEFLHIIIVQPGDRCETDRIVDDFPSWLDYDLFTANDIANVYKENMWLFQSLRSVHNDHHTSTAQMFGTLIADRDFIYYLGRDTLPVKDANGNIIDPIEEHLVNLLTPATPYYYNPLYDAYKSNADFPRGYPYSLREGVVTGISLGHLIHGALGDSFTLSSSSPIFRSNDIPGRIELHPVQTIPFGVFYSLHMVNIAINRVLVGPTLYLPTAIQDKLPIGEKNLVILSGWLMKKMLEHVYSAVKHGGKTHVFCNPVNQTVEEIGKSLKEDLVWSLISEKVWRSIAEISIHERTHDSSVEAFKEVTGVVRSFANSIHPAFLDLANAMDTYHHLWEKTNSFYPSYYAVASRSSKAPNPNAKHQCAVLCVFYEEPYFLSLWLRYYTKHFPNAVYLLHHHRNDSDPTPNLPNLPGANYTYWELYGEPHGFSVIWVAAMASVYQMRFLRSGYKCVLFTDIDEYIIPNLDKYPNGLIDYITNFQNKSDVLYTRVAGYDACHISEKGENSPPLEKPVDWNQSIFEQRHYWKRNRRYDKPLLSKTLIRYKAGQHTAFLPTNIGQDNDLHMYHAATIDKDYCLIREKAKYEFALQMPAMDRSKGFSQHLMEYPQNLKSGKLCKNSRGWYQTVTNKAFDALGEEVERIPSYISRAVI